MALVAGVDWSEPTNGAIEKGIERGRQPRERERRMRQRRGARISICIIHV